MAGASPAMTHELDQRERSALARSAGASSLHLEIFRRRLAAVGDQFVFHLLAFVERAKPRLLDRRDVDEHVLAAAAAALGLNKSVAFGRIEPFHRTGRHFRLLKSALMRLRPPDHRTAASPNSAVS